MYAKSIAVSDFSTASNPVYTVPAKVRAKWVLAFASNSSGSSVSNVAITWNNGSSVPIVGSKTMASGDVLLFGSGNYVILEAGDTITVSAGSAGISGIFTIEEENVRG